MTTPNPYDINEKKDFVLLNRASAPEVFIEGVSQVMVGFPLTKIVFHTVVEPKDGKDKEVRRVVQTLSMPTIAAVELAKIITELCRQSGNHLTEIACAEYGTKLNRVLTKELLDPMTIKKVEG